VPNTSQSCWKQSAKGGARLGKKKNTEKEVQQGPHTACAQPEPSLPPNKQIAHLLAVSFFCFFSFFPFFPEKLTN
jgi:hypothetical protein